MSERGTRWDRVVEGALRLVSPRRAAIRAHHRQMLEGGDYASAFHLAARMRGYKSAQSGTNRTPWANASDRTGDGELVPSLPALRNRSRALSPSIRFRRSAWTIVQSSSAPGRSCFHAPMA